MTTPTVVGERHHGDPSPDGGQHHTGGNGGMWGSETTRDQGLGQQPGKKKPLRDILCVFRLLANYTQLNVSFQIHYVA